MVLAVPPGNTLFFFTFDSLCGLLMVLLSSIILHEFWSFQNLLPTGSCFQKRREDKETRPAVLLGTECIIYCAFGNQKGKIYHAMFR